ncbi:MAG: hypothetical protein LBD81_01530 [Holosporaceae bacterium]|jgi:hypothetical protein|nr:hypothetical protein [Holosporaceae bacterium]
MAMDNIIEESGMSFVTDNAFRIEKSTNIKEVKSVDFVLIHNKSLIFIEAKTSFPNPHNPSKENFEKFRKGIGDIYEKFIHSLNMYSSIKLGVRDEELPKNFINTGSVKLVFVLIIKNHETSWCNELKNILTGMFPKYLNGIWNHEVFVINHKTAIKYKLTVSCENAAAEPDAQS